MHNTKDGIWLSSEWHVRCGEEPAFLSAFEEWRRAVERSGEAEVCDLVRERCRYRLLLRLKGEESLERLRRSALFQRWDDLAGAVAIRWGCWQLWSPSLVDGMPTKVSTTASTCGRRPSAAATRAEPPRYKMALLVWLALFPLLWLIFSLAGGWLMALPLPVRLLVVTGVVVPVMSYLLLPLLTRAFAGWLQPKCIEYR
ncbi:hypothetical protein ACN2MM_13040 [Alkalilimnicola ehrlichii MLHE-1]|uniref:Antibiotic biosynthesis monooxygenase n=1 Tax=Alkalilimnicola ehrlichii (strain ATCC BAA-1101 / DSM 17681 / MLHE-1) TaxID=187272 RepID=Q0A5U2_ALKEH|nr:hypothetical protein [Alkalilimnicola ehrlichii]ABI57795.1 conserved hypothetical protein [Alkalilimnicola ehrlichii MLHE-1]